MVKLEEHSPAVRAFRPLGTWTFRMYSLARNGSGFEERSGHSNEFQSQFGVVPTSNATSGTHQPTSHTVASGHGAECRTISSTVSRTRGAARRLPLFGTGHRCSRNLWFFPTFQESYLRGSSHCHWSCHGIRKSISDLVSRIHHPFDETRKIPGKVVTSAGFWNDRLRQSDPSRGSGANESENSERIASINPVHRSHLDPAQACNPSSRMVFAYWKRCFAKLDRPWTGISVLSLGFLCTTIAIPPTGSRGVCFSPAP